ncbi:MAG TPA: glycine C-acetyltransferase [Myxococcales bacterium LLY-WYZ-16_1]|jgi:glycine C-acetyltransferase|nr:glycine C-acetyltransferase [Myxococcales bacterium LLY-WYZ-16_1]
MYGAFQTQYREELTGIEQAGLLKRERVIETPQEAKIRADPGGEVLNFCANNYLGLANHPTVLAAAHEALDRYGFGLASVRFICGTQTIHKDLEAAISAYMGTEDTILYSSCFDANGGLFETILGPDDAVISDALNHASIIDGIRLCKAERHRFAHSDMNQLEDQLRATQDKRRRLIATDGVFSMDGDYAKLDQICDLADRYDAMVMLDDCHATGFVGATGRGTPEMFGVRDRVDIVTSTLGKALGGASGGFTTGRKEIIDLLRQRSRPYLFSNTLAPVIAGASLAVLDMLTSSTERRDILERNTRIFRERMKAAGFEISGDEHPIAPVMIGDARQAAEMADDLLGKGIYVIGFSYPVVPKGQARIRTQMSAAHTEADLDKAIDAFIEVGKARGSI